MAAEPPSDRPAEPATPADAASATGLVPVVDPTRCPLCGASNQCVMADPATRAAAQAGEVVCWCVTARVDPAQLARVPPGARMQACLCPACAAGFRPAPADR